MRTENYKILGVSETASDEEIKARYDELRKKYEEDRWLYGEEGNEAARKLTALESAYAEILSERATKQSESDGTHGEIAELIRQGDLSKAQAMLDGFNERDAEWHYLQAVIFYKKNWSNESKKQLEIAMQMSPGEEKYRSAYEKMNEKDDYEKQSAKSRESVRYDRYDEDDGQMGGRGCSECISCCYTYLCVDCLFSLCCGCR